MKVVTGPRQSGKTTEAIRLANEHDAYLVVHTRERARQVYHGENYPELDRFPLTYQELKSGHLGQPRRVVIDDLGMLLGSTFDVPVEAVTATASSTTTLQDDVRGDNR